MMHLNLEGSLLSSIEFVRNFCNLKTFIISNDKIDTLEPLSNCHFLTCLDMGDNNKVTCLGPLSNCTSLEQLYMQSNKNITSLEQLEPLCSLFCNSHVFIRLHNQELVNKFFEREHLVLFQQEYGADWIPPNLFE